MKDDNQFIRTVYRKYFITSCFAILCSGIGQIVNNLVVGNSLGSMALSIMSLVIPVYYIFATLGNLLGIGATAVCATLTGEEKEEECKKAFTVTYFIMVISSVLISAILIPFLPQIIRFLGADDKTFEGAYQYVIVMVIGGVFTAGTYLSFNFLRLDGRNKESTGVFVLMAITNICLDVVLIDFKMLGVSIATSSGAAAATLFGAFVLFTKSKNLRLTKISLHDIRKYSGEIIRVGSPGAMENICILLRSFSLNLIILTNFGGVALSSLSVVNSVNSFALAIIAGAAGTLVPFIGIFSAEKDIKSIKKILRTSAMQGIGWTLLFSILCFILAPYIGTAFGMKESAEQNIVVPAIRIFVLSLVPSMINHIMIFMDLANKRILISNTMTIMRNFVMIFFFVIILVNPFQLSGIWYAFLACEIGTFLVGILLHFVTAIREKNVSKITLLNEDILKQGKDISFVTHATTESIMHCVDQISSFCEKNDLSPKQSMLISLSLEELLQSIRVHSLKEDSSATMSVRILLYNDIIVLRIRNNGILFNPIEYYEKSKGKSEVVANGEDAAIEDFLELEDSLGIKMIVDACEVVHYKTTFGVNNLTVIL